MQGGVRFYGVHVKPDVLVESDQGSLLDVLRSLEIEVLVDLLSRGTDLKVLSFKPGSLKQGKGVGPYERIKGGVVFIPVSLATHLRDGFTGIGVARLRTWLESHGAAKVTYDLTSLGV